ncbi:MAG: DUF637 domain-containing protein [Alphaproteobacteria bacterium]
MFLCWPGGIATEFGAGVANALQAPAVATPFVSGIATAGAKSLFIQGGLGLLNHQGNVFKAVEDLGKPKALKSIATAIATAGLVGPAPEGGVFSANFAENLAAHGVQHLNYGLKAGAISFAINGGSGKDALKSAGLLAASSAVQASVANELGVLRKEGLDSFTHKMGHALAGAAAGAILDPKNPGKGAAAGALGAVVGETVAEWQLGIPQLLENQDKLLPQDLPTREHIETTHNLALLSAATAALLAKQDVHIAIHTADTAVENNNALALAILGIEAADRAVGVGEVVLESWEIYEQEGAPAAFKNLAVEGGTAILLGATGRKALKAVKTLGKVNKGLKPQAVIGKGEGVSKSGLGVNPFKGKTPKQIDKMFKDKGFEARGKDPVNGKGSYFHPKSGRKYYIDKGDVYKSGKENPHVDVHHLNRLNKNLENFKKRYPLGDKLYE